jgi:hypothetical protein
VRPELIDAVITLGTYPEWKALEEAISDEIEIITNRILTPGVEPLETEIGRITRTILQDVIALPREAAEEKEGNDESGS